MHATAAANFRVSIASNASHDFHTFFCFIASHNSINSFLFVLGGSDFICFYFCLLLMLLHHTTGHGANLANLLTTEV